MENRLAGIAAPAKITEIIIQTRCATGCDINPPPLASILLKHAGMDP